MPHRARLRHVLVQLARDATTAPDAAARLVDMVDAALRAEYPAARVTVILDHSVTVDRIAVVAADPLLHEESVRKLVEQARALLLQGEG